MFIPALLFLIKHVICNQNVYLLFIETQAKIVHWTVLLQHLSRAMSRVRVQIMNQFERKSHEYKATKRYWKLIQQDSRKLSDKRFYRPTFRMHLTNKEILDKLLSYSEDLKHHYNVYQLLLFHFQNKEPEKFFGLIEDNLKEFILSFRLSLKPF